MDSEQLHHEAYLEYLRWHRDVRLHYSTYYEKLALLDGGTIALATTVALGSSHAPLRHKWTMALGLSILAIALVSLLIRNLAEMRREAVMTDQQYALVLQKKESADRLQPRIEGFGKVTSKLEKIGVYCTVAGLTILAGVLILALI